MPEPITKPGESEDPLHARRAERALKNADPEASTPAPNEVPTIVPTSDLTHPPSIIEVRGLGKLEFPWSGLDQSPPKIEGVRITKLLGRGGQGIVYEAVRESPQQLVAVKVPLIDRNVEARCARLRVEAEGLANLTHANIIKLLEVTTGEVEGTTVPCVLMELVEDGRSITRHVQAAELSQRGRVELMIKVAEAIQQMHERSREFHRDLKPDNILVGRDGEPKVIDVGMAVSGNAGARMRERGAIVGTIDYMAPEQFDRDPAYLTQRTDVYALGVILFEVLTGKLPYDLDAMGEADREYAIRNTPPRKLAEHCQLEFPALEHVVAVALRKEIGRRQAEKRWSTPQELADQLKKAISSPDAAARALTPWGDLQRVALRCVPLASVLVVSLLAWLFAESLASATGTSDAFESRMFTTLPPAMQGVSLQHTTVVGFKSVGEVTEVLQFLSAKGHRIENVDLTKAKTWRPIYPALLAELFDSDAPPEVVAFDVVFGDPREADDAWADPIKRANFPVVVCLDTGKVEEASTQTLNTTLHDKTLLEAKKLQLGGNIAMFDKECAWSVNLLLQRGSTLFRAGLPLQVWVADQSWEALNDDRVNNPGREYYFVPSEAGRLIKIECQVSKLPGVNIPVEKAPKLEVTATSTERIGTPTEEDRVHFGLRSGDRLTHLMVAMPSQQALDNVTHSIIEVLKAPPKARRDWFKGRAVFIANMTSTVTDHFIHPDGRDIWGVYGHAVAYEAMLTGGGIHRIDDLFLFSAVVIAALLPLVLVRVFRLRTWVLLATVVVVVATATVLMFVLSYWLMRNTLWYVPVYAPAAAAIGSCLVILVLSMAGRGRPWGIHRKGVAHEASVA